MVFLAVTVTHSAGDDDSVAADTSFSSQASFDFGSRSRSTAARMKGNTALLHTTRHKCGRKRLHALSSHSTLGEP